MGHHRGVSFLQESPADERRRAGLRRMRTVATGLLVLAAVVFVATLRLDHDGVWGFVNTAAEAAMVGALADWFAVTALFRHPLGVPVPHTALVKKRKDELGRSLQEFVTENFLTEEIARDRLAAAHVAERVGTWLGEPAHRERVLTEVTRGGARALERVADDDVHDFLEQLLLPRLAQEPISPILGSLLEGVVEGGNHTGLVDLGLDEVRTRVRERAGLFEIFRLGIRNGRWRKPEVVLADDSWDAGEHVTEFGFTDRAHLQRRVTKLLESPLPRPRRQAQWIPSPRDMSMVG